MQSRVEIESVLRGTFLGNEVEIKSLFPRWWQHGTKPNMPTIIATEGKTQQGKKSRNSDL